MNTETNDLVPQGDATQPANGLLPAQSLTPAPSTLRRIFIGADGLRAGWSVLIFIALFAALMIAENVARHRLDASTFAPSADKAAPNKPLSLRNGLIYESLPLLAVLLVTWVMAKIERRPTSVYGLGGKRKLARFFAGLAWGVTCLSLLVFILWKTGLLVIDGRLVFGSDIVRYGALWLFGFFLVGVFEEFLTRGYLQYTLSRGLAGLYRWAFKARNAAGWGFWTAALAFSILFGLGHGKNPDESPIGLLSAGLLAMVFCLSLWRTGSLWWAIGFHASWDWAQSFLYGVADSGIMVQHHLLATHPAGKPIFSGGATGPEGSIVILAMMGLIIIVIQFTLPRTGEAYAANLPVHAAPPRIPANVSTNTSLRTPRSELR